MRPSALVVLFCSSLSALSFAAPKIQSVEGVFSQDGVITIHGAGFGNKAQAAPVLYDWGASVIENGKVNQSRASVSNGYKILTASEGSADPIYDKPSASSTGVNVQFVTNRPGRTKYSQGHYWFKGKNGYIGWPNAYGGGNTPKNNEQLYLSWQFKPRYNTEDYWTWKLKNVKGTFKQRSGSNDFGETIRFSNGKTAKIIAINGDTLHMMVDQKINSTELKGTQIQGVSSGAVAILSDESGAYYAPGSDKFVRVWEEPTGTNGLLMAWSNVGLAIRKPDGKNVYGYGAAGVVPGKWNHMEVFVDLQQKIAVASVNGKVLHSVDLTGVSYNTSAYSPTIALLGFNGSHMDYQEVDFGEIYMDSTPQRVLIANAPELSKATKIEIQYPTSWQDNKVVAKVNEGLLERGEKLYVFIVDKLGNATPVGYPICEDCQAPPVAPVLKVATN